jgi:hypothetical protein
MTYKISQVSKIIGLSVIGFTIFTNTAAAAVINCCPNTQTPRTTPVSRTGMQLTSISSTVVHK